ncbi:MAG: class I SAM-dependent methyltransferase [Patescibacteria group bacterium]
MNEVYRKKIEDYYDYTLNFYKLFWHGDTRAVHYGIWDEQTKNLRDALFDMNKFLAEKANIRRGEKVLDAGCGVGGSAFWLVENLGAQVVGITIS